MRKRRTERQMRRSRAAEILGDITARTLRRYELQGLLTPIKRNSRLTLYSESEVFRLRDGKVAASSAATITATQRNGGGEFSTPSN